MSFLNGLFSKKQDPIKSYSDFWNWFEKNEKAFFNVIKEQGNVERVFFDKLSPKLGDLKDGFFYLTGMYNDDTVELVLTADGDLKNIVSVEELVKSSPDLKGWKFTALKPALDIADVNIKMNGYSFNNENLSFYSNEYAEYPDQIDITIVHNDFNEENNSTIINGIYIFLDNYLGELNSVTNIDNLKVIGKSEAVRELVPIAKLKDFLNWRQKEFIEKYEGLRHTTDSDSYSVLEAERESGNALIAVINTDLLNWDSKASHRWILTVELKYDGKKNREMPDKPTSALLEEIESKILLELKDSEGYLNIGRQTSNGVREIYFACKDFRKPSKVLHEIQNHYTDRLEIKYDIYNDKYWQSFNRFNRNID